MNHGLNKNSVTFKKLVFMGGLRVYSHVSRLARIYFVGSALSMLTYLQ